MCVCRKKIRDQDAWEAALRVASRLYWTFLRYLVTRSAAVFTCASAWMISCEWGMKRRRFRSSEARLVGGHHRQWPNASARNTCLETTIELNDRLRAFVLQTGRGQIGDRLQCLALRMKGTDRVLNDSLYEDVLTFCMRILHAVVRGLESRWKRVEWVGCCRRATVGDRIGRRCCAMLQAREDVPSQP